MSLELNFIVDLNHWVLKMWGWSSSLVLRLVQFVFSLTEWIGSLLCVTFEIIIYGGAGVKSSFQLCNYLLSSCLAPSARQGFLVIISRWFGTNHHPDIDVSQKKEFKLTEPLALSSSALICSTVSTQRPYLCPRSQPIKASAALLLLASLMGH